VKSKCKRYEIQTNIPSRQASGPGVAVCFKITRILAEVSAAEFWKL